MANTLDYSPQVKSFGVETDEANTKLFVVVTTQSKYLGQSVEQTIREEVPETITTGALTTVVDTATEDAWVAAGFEYPV